MALTPFEIDSAIKDIQHNVALQLNDGGVFGAVPSQHKRCLGQLPVTRPRAFMLHVLPLPARLLPQSKKEHV